MTLGERLFDLRAKSGESLQDVADAIGVSKAHVWELEKGRSSNPSYELVRALARHFQVSIDVLIGEEAAPTKKEQRIERIHRDLQVLSDRDRTIVEDLIRSLRETSGTGA